MFGSARNTEFLELSEISYWLGQELNPDLALTCAFERLSNIEISVEESVLTLVALPALYSRVTLTLPC